MYDKKALLNFDFQNPKTSLEKANLTLAWIIKVITKSKNFDVEYLTDLLKKQKINSISLDCWDDPICGNILFRIRKILNEEANIKNDDDTLQGLLLNTMQTLSMESGENFKEKVFEALNEMQIELENCLENIAIQALEHIHADETIMTLGHSETVETFLKQAAKTRKFHVIIAEAFPSLSGHLLAKNLTDNKDGTNPISSSLTVSLIPDSAIFAIMSRVNKVILGCDLMLANGGVVAKSGSFNIAASAKHYSVPVFVCAGIYKLTPTYMAPPNVNVSPAQYEIPYYGDFDPLSEDGTLSYLTQSNDTVPPELITVYISNTGSYAPSYVYQMMRELYNKEDLI